MPKFKELNQLANYLDTLPSEKFYMPQWGNLKTVSKVSCGSAGCTAGWAVNLFHNKGFFMELNMSGDTVIAACPVFIDEDGDEHTQDGAFAMFFEIPDEDASWITMLDDDAPRYPSYTSEYGVLEEDILPQHAAERIRTTIVRLGGNVDRSIQWPVFKVKTVTEVMNV